MSSDIAVGSTLTIPTHSNKTVPYYLVKMATDKKSLVAGEEFFISFGEPDLNSNFLHVKGFFSGSKREDIVANYKDMVANTDPSQMVEMWMPWHTVHSIRSLVFKTSVKK